MKKVILAALASTVIASSASASFYAGGNFGVNLGQYIFSKDKDALTKVELNRQYDTRGAIEFGYNILDNVGIGIEGGMYLSPSVKSDDKAKSTDVDFGAAVVRADTKKPTFVTADALKADPAFAGFETTANHSFDIMYGIVKARVDLVDFDMAQIYATAGAGVSYIGEEYSVKTEAVAEESTKKSYPAVSSMSEVKVKMDKNTTLAFAGGLGVAFKLSDSMLLNVGVEYANLGETSDKMSDDEKKKSVTLGKDGTAQGFNGKTKFDAVNVVAGVRFCF